MDGILTWLEATTVAGTVRESIGLTSALSALHALGFTCIMGGALFANLGRLGVLFPGRPVRELTVPGSRLIALGLMVSVPSGVLLFAPRAMVAGHNTFFELKMGLLLTAAAVQFGLLRRETRAIGAASLLLWIGLAAAACAFILLE
ncbi:MAG TPA: hypothetical protein VGQ37_22875 [Vicinamibacterales bacterium]|jgi:hypothetical protein|nr:hypothetical protein [Vicinamibacterales bacterium]